MTKIMKKYPLWRCFVPLAIHEKNTRWKKIATLFVFSYILASVGWSQKVDEKWVEANYDKQEIRIEVRDGVRLFTAIYTPKEEGNYPIMLKRTPYSLNPYGEEVYPGRLGPTDLFAKEKYIFVYQDVRGKFMSEGEFVDMRSPLPPGQKSRKSHIDESTDTYDTVEWLVKNVKSNNGKVGLWGISYPGYYTAAGVVNTHPAIAAASPQAPVSNWFLGDDFHHNGAFFLPHFFNFISVFGLPRPELTQKWGERFKHGHFDGYRFFKEMGPLKNANEKYLKGNIAFWNEVMEHGNYDNFWKSKNLNDKLYNISCPVMTVGGWFDAENCYGALNVYKHIERQNPDIFNILVEGPWVHGGWVRTPGDSLGDISFGAKTSEFYQPEIELKFFNHFLKGKGEMNLPEAMVFETGANQWHSLESWPPVNTRPQKLYFSPKGALSFELPLEQAAFDSYVSDPEHPVPFMKDTYIGMPREYMVADQRHAATRPDVLVFQTEVLEEDLRIAGPFTASIRFETDVTDCDLVVKLIDVYPDSASVNESRSSRVHMGGYQMLLRGEPFRTKYRNSFEKPEPLRPNEVESLEFELPDVFHTFKKGHRIMVQVQSSWFPLVDRNPQTFTDIYSCDESSFQKARIRIHRSSQHASYIELPILKP